MIDKITQEDSQEEQVSYEIVGLRILKTETI